MISEDIKNIKNKIKGFSKIKNLNFLFGAGTSSYAIPNMKMICDALFESIENGESSFSDYEKKIFEEVKCNNLEKILGLLHAKKYYLESIETTSDQVELDSVKSIILYIQNFMFERININFSDDKSKVNLSLYELFYRKISRRNKDLSRINVFTTNNDLFNEKAMSMLGINYNNGFSSGLDRYFNPARFKFTLSKRVDSTLKKYEEVEEMVYLYKLHGSVNWVEVDDKVGSLFNIQEKNTRDIDSSQQVLIYPTPMKQNQSLGAPYSDLIREFQVKLSMANSVLFIVGYSFSDEHLNNIIYQALSSNSSISIVIFGNRNLSPLSTLDDSRIYTIYGECEGNRIHYFKYIVEELFEYQEEHQDDDLLSKFVESLSKLNEDGL